ncbi:hypothetical protein [Microbispora hainanensis]|uniref:hypothetical protein n=1 Tax=Microbispora hainanensis TaxID=568844 RepID=UPI00324763EC
MELRSKIAVFCRELDRGDLLQLAKDAGKEWVFARALDRLRAGQVGADLEKDLDLLDQLVTRVDPQGLFSRSRQYEPVPGRSGASGARWWACPDNLCAGRSRVQPGQAAPNCEVLGQVLAAEPL